MFLIPLVIIGLILWVLLSPGTRDRIRSGLGGDSRSPLDIARVRYAKGEISKEQFEQIKKDLA